MQLPGPVADLRRQFRWEDALAHLDWNAHERLNLAHEACDRWSTQRGKVAIVWVGTEGQSQAFTYYELRQLSNRLANVLRRLGVTQGDRVAAVMPRIPEAYVTPLAVWKAGGVYVPIYSGFGPDAVRYRFAKADVKVVVTEARYRDLVAQALHADIPVLTVGSHRGVGIVRGDYSYWHEIEAASPSFTTVETRAHDPCTIIFTSGTTGLPKGCVIPHGSLVGLIPFVQHVMALRPDDLVWATADPSWVFGLLSTGVAPMALGFPRLVYEGDFDPTCWWRIAESYDVTHVAAAPTAFRLLAAAGDRPLRERRLVMRRATSAGEPLNPEPIRWLQEHVGIEVFDAYGLTEVGFVVGNFPGLHPLQPGSMGFPIPGYDVMLVDANHRPVHAGEPGIIAVKGHPWFMSCGYWGMEEEWRARWDGDWFSTGDTAYQDEQGYLWFVGRHDDVIVSGGINVGPFEVESVLVTHPAVAEVAVVAKPDAGRGSIVKAYVVLADRNAPSQDLVENLQGLVRERVGRHAWPREIEFVPELPKTVSGKILRAELRRRAAIEGTTTSA